MDETAPSTSTYPDLIPKILTVPSLNLLGGGSGVGKTALLAGLIRDIQAGKPIFGHQTTPPPKVGYIAADRPAASARQWFTAAGVTEIALYSLLDDFHFSLRRLERPKPGEHAQIFAEMADKLQLPKGSLLVVDPISLFLGGNLNDYTRCALGCMNLYREIMPRQLNVIGVVHSSKQSADAKQRYGRLQDRLSGSMAQLGYSATQMYLAGPDEIGESHHAFVWNPHHAKSEVFTLKQDDKTGLFTTKGTPQATDTPGDVVTPLSADEASLLAILPAAGVPFTAQTLLSLHSDQQLARTTLWRRLKALEARGLVRQLQKPNWTRTEPQTPDDQTVADDQHPDQD